MRKCMQMKGLVVLVVALAFGVLSGCGMGDDKYSMPEGWDDMSLSEQTKAIDEEIEMLKVEFKSGLAFAEILVAMGEPDKLYSAGIRVKTYMVKHRNGPQLFSIIDGLNDQAREAGLKEGFVLTEISDAKNAPFMGFPGLGASVPIKIKGIKIQVAAALTSDENPPQIIATYAPLKSGEEITWEKVMGAQRRSSGFHRVVHDNPFQKEDAKAFIAGELAYYKELEAHIYRDIQDMEQSILSKVVTSTDELGEIMQTLRNLRFEMEEHSANIQAKAQTVYDLEMTE